MDLGAWLSGLGLEDFRDAFRENGVDADLLAELTNDDLKDLGVARLADRKRLLKAIAELPTGGEGHGRLRLAAGERRQVTVLFADISGFTQLSGELGGEVTHSLLNRYFEVLDTIVEGYGGSIDKHMGDNVMAVFGAPVAHTDDPQRALRSALDMHEAMTELSREQGRGILVHIGIASGQVVASGTGSEAHREYTVTGDCVNLAARLQGLAEGGETLVSKPVQQASAGVAASVSRGQVAVKGFPQGVEVWAVERLRGETRVDRAAAFVGRRHELRQFSALLEGVLDHGQGHSLLVRGEPGIGKTRLMEEFDRMAGAGGLARHRGRILDFGVAKGEDAVRALVASLLSVMKNKGLSGREEASRRATTENLVSEKNRPFLFSLLDLPQLPETRAIYDAMDNETRKQGTRETVCELVRSLGDRGPMLLTVEDVHWADRITLEHLAGIAAAVTDVRALLVMTSRLEAVSPEQGWLASLQGSASTIMELQPLRHEEALALASDFVQGDLGPLESFVRRAEGNPLFLEQLLQNAREGSQQDLPDTLQGLVLARVDRLSRTERNALQAASVLGQRFSLDSLHHVLEAAPYDLARLVEHRILRSDGEDYLFAHALLRDGIYSSLLQARREALHGRAAEFFAARDSILHAEHLDRAGSAEASRAYLAAAEEEAGHVRYESALSLVARALEIAPEAESFALRRLEGELQRSLGAVQESITAYNQALSVAEGDSGRCRALIGVAEGLRLTDQHAEMFRILDEAEPAAERQGLMPEQARALQLRGNVFFIRGDIEDCLHVNRGSLKLARAAASAELEAQALGGLGEADFARGRIISAYQSYDDCIKLGRRQGFLRVAAANLSMRGQTLCYRNRLELAMADCRAAMELARKIRQPRAEMIAGIVVAYVRELSDPHEGRDWATASLDMARRLGARLFEAINLEYLGRFAQQMGDPGEAEKLITEALDILRESESGMRFLAARTFGALALVLRDEDRRIAALDAGEALLQKGAPAHNHLWFNRDAMEVCLRSAQWERVERTAKALEDYTAAEPLPWSDFFIARGRALAAFGRHGGDAKTLEALQQLRDEAERVGHKNALPAIEQALASI